MSRSARRSAAAGATSFPIGQLQQAAASFGEGRLEVAENQVRRLLRKWPNEPNSLHLLGVVLYKTDRPREALAPLRRALRDLPRMPDLHANLGNALQALGEYEQAEAAQREAVRLNPAYGEGWYNLGNALYFQDRFAEAEEAYKRALELMPPHEDLYYNYGLSLVKQKDQDKYAAGISWLEGAIARYPDYMKLYNGVGHALMEYNIYDQAIRAFEAGLARDPDDTEAAIALATAYQEYGHHDRAYRLLKDAVARITHGEIHTSLLFSVNYHPTLPPQAIYDEYRAYHQRWAAGLAPRRARYRNDRTADRRLRVGYISADFKGHSMANFTLPWLSHHDPAVVETFLYPTHVMEHPVTDRFREIADHWHPVDTLSDEEAVRQIRDDRIDILVDFTGHTAYHRLFLLARRPAPIQATCYGTGYTTGLPEIDYFIGDPWLTPQACQPFMAERIWQLPVSSLVFDPVGRSLPDPAPLPALRNGHVRFGYFGRSIRINDDVVAAWTAILKAVPGSRLVINHNSVRFEQTQVLMRQRFEAHDIDPDRLDLFYETPPWEAYGTIDIALDPFPHNAGTTTLDAVSLGVPVVSLAHPCLPIGRFGALFLTKLGLPELVAGTTGDYIRIAAELAGDPDRLAALRASLPGRLENSEMRDFKGFTRAVEAAYRAMWQGWLESEA